MQRERVSGWIGWRVDDVRGRRIGRVSEVLVDRATGAPQWLVVRLTWPHDQHLPVPITDELLAGAGVVHTPWTRTRLLGAPRMWRHEALTARLEAEACAWFGVPATRGAQRRGWERRATSAPIADAERFAAPEVELRPRPVPAALLAA